MGSGLSARCPLSPVHCSPRRREAGGGGFWCAALASRGCLCAEGMPLAASRGVWLSAPVSCSHPSVPRRKLSCAPTTPLVSAVGVSPCRRTDLGRAGGAQGLSSRSAPASGSPQPPPRPLERGSAGAGHPAAALLPTRLRAPWLASVHRRSPPPFPFARERMGYINGAGWALGPLRALRWNPTPPPARPPAPGAPPARGSWRCPRGAPAPAASAVPWASRWGRSRAAGAPAGPRAVPTAPPARSASAARAQRPPPPPGAASARPRGLLRSALLTAADGSVGWLRCEAPCAGRAPHPPART